MKEERSIVAQVLAAQQDRQAADTLIEQYMPFIKSETAKVMGRFPGGDDDELSIAMFAFYEAVMAYREGKGSFLNLASMTIKNRLIDNYRKERRHQGQLSLDMQENPEEDTTLGQKIADPASDHHRHHDRWDAQQEITHFSRQLSGLGISLTEVAMACPKQDRTLRECMKVLSYARQNPWILKQLTATGKLPVTALHKGAGVDVKTMERHRKYIVAILLAYTNGFEIIRGHLAAMGGKEAGTK